MFQFITKSILRFFSWELLFAQSASYNYGVGIYVYYIWFFFSIRTLNFTCNESIFIVKQIATVTKIATGSWLDYDAVHGRQIPQNDHMVLDRSQTGRYAMAKDGTSSCNRSKKPASARDENTASRYNWTNNFTSKCDKIIKNVNTKI